MKLSVSAGQQMQMSGELKGGGQVSVAAQQGLYFSHGQQHQQQTQQPGQHGQQQQHAQQHNQQHSQQHTQQQQHNQHQQQQQQNNISSPQHRGSGMGDSTYTLSQSQTINFTQQTLRQRHPQQAGPQGMHAACVARVNGGIPAMSHVDVSGATREHRAKMLQLQQQQMLRAQHQQGAARPPPPEYKAARMMQVGGVGGVGVGGAAAAEGLALPRWRSAFAPPPLLRPLHPQHPQQRRAPHPQQMPQQNMLPHLIAQQNQGIDALGQMSSVHMSQSQSLSMLQAGDAAFASPAAFPPSAADFNLDFLDGAGAAPSDANFTAHDLLSSLEGVPGFGLGDIL